MILSTLYKKKLDELLLNCRRNLNEFDENLIVNAFKFSLNAHKLDKRASGEPFVVHPYEVASIIAKEIPLDDITVASGLLHDVIEDTKFTYQDVKEEFGQTIADIVDGATKIEGMFENYETKQVENYRKMLLSMSNDIRVILVKFADRLHNMRTLEYLSPERQVRMARETMEIYAPLSHRLGLSRVKIEFEDLAFKFLDRQFYSELAKKVIAKKREREAYVSKFIQPIKAALLKDGFKYEINGRAKHLYSIAKKMKLRNKSFEEIYDLFAVRIILDTPNKNDCFTAYGMCSEIYIPVPERFKDYISLPKKNGYQSIHTTLLGPEGKMVEVQIRTQDMHEVAEKGVAAHWKYKENINSNDKQMEDWITWIREMFEGSSKDSTPKQILESLKLNLYQDEIYVFTPKGELKILPVNSSPVDFAFEIHTEVGYKCIGAKVNGKITPLDTKLKSGDQVEIITSKIKRPNKDWEKFVVTHKAKSEIHKWINNEKRKKVDLGREMWEKKLKKMKHSLSEDELIKLLHRLRFENLQHFYFSIADNKANVDELFEILKDKNKLLSGEIISPLVKPLDKKDIVKEKEVQANLFETYIKTARSSKSNIIASGDVKDLMFSYANCCNPIPGEDIIGFITKTEGVKIHKKSCKNLTNLFLMDPDRLIDVQWPEETEDEFFVGIKIDGEDRPGMLNAITQVVSSYENTNIKSVNIASKGSTFEGTVILMVKNITHLNQLLDKLRNLGGVFEVRRFEE
ncbi:MAG: bifunctional (p)ppGpp synthetase/guanosine-3',5'-bis(diphosphate) 3'-pyrophosphohydrolase [Ignavibacteriae bacterium]|nr:MAG: bifunctional (p)ppGpp synthetase/guanosine-3',5'-bis(diphosphate) 3'-pyrophosphohydrolase [Ignavibacteriota bacterium]